MSIFCVVTIIFQHCLNCLGHEVNRSFTGCHWSPLSLLHDDITELVDVRDLALLHLPFEDAHRCSIGFRSGDMLGQSITFTPSFFSKAVVVIMLEYCPAAQSPKGGDHALLQYVTVHVGSCDMAVYRHGCDSAIITACQYSAMSHRYECDIAFI